MTETFLNHVLPPDYVEAEKLYAAASGQDVKTLAICAATHGEGVSSVTWGLAQRYAAADIKVLVIDFQTDARRRSLSSMLGPNDQSWQQTGAPIPVAVGDTGIDMITPPDKPALLRQLREDNTVTALLDGWQRQYEMVIFDLPAVMQKNQGNIAAESIAGRCDGVFLVVKAGQTSEATLIDCKNQLETAGAMILGAVLNDRQAPSLLEELVRETRRLDRILPKLMKKARCLLRQSAFLRQEI